jgi:hypothetical protein
MVTLPGSPIAHFNQGITQTQDGDARFGQMLKDWPSIADIDSEGPYQAWGWRAVPVTIDAGKSSTVMFRTSYYQQLVIGPCGWRPDSRALLVTALPHLSYSPRQLESQFAIKSECGVVQLPARRNKFRIALCHVKGLDKGIWIGASL